MRRSPSRALTAVAVLAVAAAAPRAGAQESSTPKKWDLDLSVASAMLGGHTTYHIDIYDPQGSGASELEFPLGGIALGLQAELAARRAPGEDRWVFGLGLLTTVSGSGTMKDSDWLPDWFDYQLYGVTHPGKDIYSESHAELNALVLDARVAWELQAARGLIVAPMGGVLYQRFSYDVSDVTQVGYGPYAADASGSAAGPVLQYRVAYLAPYVGGRASFATGPFSVSADAWFSPAASADDTDDHLLRQKRSTTDASGTAWQVSLGARLAVGAQGFLTAQASWVAFSTSGTQHQRFYDGSNEEYFVPSKVTSSRSAFLLVYGHRLAL